MSARDKVYILMNDGVKRTSRRIAQELNRPAESIRRDLQELRRLYPDSIQRTRDPKQGMVYWRK